MTVWDVTPRGDASLVRWLAGRKSAISYNGPLSLQ